MWKFEKGRYTLNNTYFKFWNHGLQNKNTEKIMLNEMNELHF